MAANAAHVWKYANPLKLLPLTTNYKIHHVKVSSKRAIENVLYMTLRGFLMVTIWANCNVACSINLRDALNL